MFSFTNVSLPINRPQRGDKGLILIRVPGLFGILSCFFLTWGCVQSRCALVNCWFHVGFPDFELYSRLARFFTGCWFVEGSLGSEWGSYHCADELMNPFPCAPHPPAPQCHGHWASSWYPGTYRRHQHPERLIPPRVSRLF